jgi:hypothetical protein
MSSSRSDDRIAHARISGTLIQRSASLAILAGVLFAPLAHAEKALESAAPQPGAPHWSAQIGTAHVSGYDDLRKREAGHSAPESGTQASSPAPAAHWSTQIGTGHVHEGSRTVEAGRFTRESGVQTSSLAPAPHWSTQIGTGRVAGS